MKDESTLVAVLAIIVMILFYYIGEHMPKYQRILDERCSIVINKESQIYSRNRNTNEDYYFLLENGSLEEVSLKAYMEYNIGDRYCYYEVRYEEIE
jgi:hypothetical protein